MEARMSESSCLQAATDLLLHLVCIICSLNMSQPGLLVQPEQQITTYLTQEGSEEEHSKFDYRSALTGVS